MCIHKKVLGTDRHLNFFSKTNQIQWSSKKPDSAWVLGPDEGDMCLMEIIKLSSVKFPEIFPEKFRKSFSSLNLNVDNIPWHMCMPTNIFKISIQNVLRVFQDVTESLEKTNYIETFMCGQEVHLGLSRALVDGCLIGKYMDESSSGPSTVASLKTFIPDATGMTKPIRYTQTKTSTGRLLVESGPSILTLAARHRNILKSKYPGGSIVQLDFVSLEPRVCRYVMGHEAPPDIYQHISSAILRSCHDRKVIKLAVLCSLYGVSLKKLAGMLGSEREARTVVRSVRKYFSVDRLEQKLRGDMVISKSITNHYGRPLKTDVFDAHVLVSHFIQSTSVDVALLGFRKVLEAIKSIECAIDPIFIIHDAILFDVDFKGAEILKNIASSGVTIDMGHFPMTMDIISSRDDI
jgi:hypothetical protein